MYFGESDYRSLIEQCFNELTVRKMVLIQQTAFNPAIISVWRFTENSHIVSNNSSAGCILLEKIALHASYPKSGHTEELQSGINYLADYLHYAHSPGGTNGAVRMRQLLTCPVPKGKRGTGFNSGQRGRFLTSCLKFSPSLLLASFNSSHCSPKSS